MTWDLPGRVDLDGDVKELIRGGGFSEWSKDSRRRYTTGGTDSVARHDIHGQSTDTDGPLRYDGLSPLGRISGSVRTCLSGNVRTIR